MGDRPQRVAGVGLWVLGGLNVLVGVAGVAAAPAEAGGRGVFAVALVAGVVMVVLGTGVRRGSRPATLAALVLLAVLAVVQVGLLVVAADVQTAVRLAVTVVLLALVARALRPA